MRIINEEYKKYLHKLPEEYFQILLKKKLEEKGITVSPKELAQIAGNILNRKVNTFTINNWKWWEDKHIDLEISQDELNSTIINLDMVVDKLPDIIEELSSTLSKTIRKSLQKDWNSQYKIQQKEKSGFEKRLRKRWGISIGLLEMLLTISREFGSNVNVNLRATNWHSPKLLDVLTLLHVRSCQIMYEIITLLNAGLADGAMTRWRTMHEIAAISLFIKQNGEELAEKYILHENIESKRAMDDYIKCQERLHYEPLKETEVIRINSTYNSLITRFGDSYANQYGWAAGMLNIKSPKFSDIEKAAGIDNLRAHYRLASHNVHANPKGVFFKLGLLNESNLLLAGPSNAGLTDPGHCSAISLIQINTALGLLEPTLDNIVILKIMLQMEKDIGEAFQQAHEKLIQEENQNN